MPFLYLIAQVGSSFGTNSDLLHFIDGKNRKAKEKWDSFVAKVFNQICIEEVLAHKGHTIA